MNDSADSSLIIQGSLQNFLLADAFNAAHNRSAMLIVKPHPNMTYPDGKSVSRLSIYFNEGAITTVQRNRYFAPNKVAALDLCAPFAPFNASTFELTLVDQEADPENFHPLKVGLFTLEMMGYSDEVLGFQNEQVVRFFRLEERAFGPDRDRAEDDIQDQFLGLVGECVQPGMDFTAAEMSESLGLSPTSCSMLLKKLQSQRLVSSASDGTTIYSGTLGKARRFQRHRLPQPTLPRR